MTIGMTLAPGDVRILRWTANPKQQAIRVHVSCAGMMCIIYLHRGKDLPPEQQAPASFCATLYDSVEAPYFQFATRSRELFGKSVSVQKEDNWLRPLKGRHWLRAEDQDASNELFDLIRAQLPAALQHWTSSGMSSSGGKFCYLTIDDDPQQPGQASINMRSDIFRQYLLEELCVLEPAMFPSIERIDLRSIRNLHFLDSAPQVLKVEVAQADGDSTDELILKIGVLADYEGPERLSKRIEESRGHQQRHFQELVSWSKVWGHENIMSPPKYLVTVPDGNRVKFVGWLQEVHRNWTDELLRPHWRKGGRPVVRKLIGYVIDLVRGMLHMAKEGYIHPDVKWSNCLFAGPKHDDHLVIFDFEHFPQGPGVYHNLNGPQSPEVMGDWDVSLDDNGQLCYSRNDPRGRYKEFTILADWAEFPEALERLQVFTFASVAASMLKYRSPNREHWDPYHLTWEEPEKLKKKREKWVALVPDAAKALLEECWSFDPRQRPLFRDILDRLEEIRNAMDGPSITNVALHQSQGGASSV